MARSGPICAPGARSVSPRCSRACEGPNGASWARLTSTPCTVHITRFHRAQPGKAAISWSPPRAWLAYDHSDPPTRKDATSHARPRPDTPRHPARLQELWDEIDKLRRALAALTPRESGSEPLPVDLAGAVAGLALESVAKSAGASGRRTPQTLEKPASAAVVAPPARSRNVPGCVRAGGLHRASFCEYCDPYLALQPPPRQAAGPEGSGVQKADAARRLTCRVGRSQLRRWLLQYSSSASRAISLTVLPSRSAPACARACSGGHPEVHARRRAAERLASDALGRGQPVAGLDLIDELVGDRDPALLVADRSGLDRSRATR